MNPLYGMLSVAGRVLLSTIFLMSALGNKIPNFDTMAEAMTKAGVPQPSIMLAGAIVFLILGSLSIILGFKVRFGATLLAVFLVLATFYFHAFWKVDAKQVEGQMIHFMKNLSMFGAMLFIMGNGAGIWSLDELLARKRAIVAPTK